jgi:hypothetical protein
LDGRIKHDVDQINEQQLLQRVAWVNKMTPCHASWCPIMIRDRTHLRKRRRYPRDIHTDLFVFSEFNLCNTVWASLQVKPVPSGWCEWYVGWMSAGSESVFCSLWFAGLI